MLAKAALETGGLDAMAAQTTEYQIELINASRDGRLILAIIVVVIVVMIVKQFRGRAG